MVCVTDQRNLDMGRLVLPIRPLTGPHRDSTETISITEAHGRACLQQLENVLVNKASKDRLAVTLPAGSDQRLSSLIQDLPRRTRPALEGDKKQSIVVHRVFNIVSYPDLDTPDTARVRIQGQLEQIEAALKRGENVLVKVKTDQQIGAVEKLAELKKDPKYNWAKSLRLEASGDKDMQQQILKQFQGRGKFNFQAAIDAKARSPLHSTWRFLKGVATSFHNWLGESLAPEPEKPTRSITAQSYHGVVAKKSMVRLLAELHIKSEGEMCTPLELKTQDSLAATLVTLQALARRSENRGKIILEFTEDIRTKLAIPKNAPQRLMIDGEIMKQVMKRFGWSDIAVPLLKVDEEVSQSRRSQPQPSRPTTDLDAVTRWANNARWRRPPHTAADN